jgi:hypothetical protein
MDPPREGQRSIDPSEEHQEPVAAVKFEEATEKGEGHSRGRHRERGREGVAMSRRCGVQGRSSRHVEERMRRDEESGASE